MSLRKALRRLAPTVAQMGAGFLAGGPAGAAAAGLASLQKPPTVSGTMSGFLPQLGGTMGAIAPALGSIFGRVLPGAGAIGGAVAVGGMAMRGVGAAARAANAWCGRNPAWCVSVGGLPAVLSMVQSGQLPLMKRRRRRGLSGRDLRGFYKTSRLMRRVAGTIGLRRTGGRGRGTSSTMITQN